MKKAQKKNNFKFKLTIAVIYTAILLCLLPFSKYFESFLSNGLFPDDYAEVLASDFKVHFISVGDADTIFLELPNGSMMIDCGTEICGEKVLEYINRLHKNKEKKIDYFVATHAHEDHIGGAKYIFDSYEIKNIIRPSLFSTVEDESLIANDNQVVDTESYNRFINCLINETYEGEISNVLYAYAGLEFNLSGVNIKFLAPNGSNYENQNNYSAVIKVSYLNKSLLFTADAEELSEKEMISNFPDELNCDVLKVAHHGSATSSSEAFLNKVKPEFYVISCAEERASKFYESYSKSTFLENNVFMTARNDNIICAIKSNGDIAFAMETKGKVEFWKVVLSFEIVGLVLIFSFAKKWKNPNFS